MAQFASLAAVAVAELSLDAFLSNLAKAPQLPPVEPPLGWTATVVGGLSGVVCGVGAAAKRCIPSGEYARGALSVVAVAGTIYYGHKTAKVASSAVCRVKDRFLRWWSPPPPPVEVDPLVRYGVKLESAYPDSYEVPLTSPVCQAIIGHVVDGVFKCVGCVVRLDEWLVVPDHVRSVCGLETQIRSANGKSILTVPDSFFDRFFIVDTDLIAAKLTEAEFGACGLRKNPLAPRIPEGKVGSFVSIVGPTGKGTTGKLIHGDAFGSVVYHGTTASGYSGAAYMVGSMIAGVHLRGGTFNGGYSASFVIALLKHHDNVRNEDSDDWLAGQKNSQARVQADPSWNDEDYVRLRVNGRYHVVTRTAVNQVFGSAWYGDLASRRRYNNDQFVDLESFSGEYQPSSRISGGSSSSSKRNPSVDEQPSHFTKKEYWQLKRLIKENSKMNESPAQSGAA